MILNMMGFGSAFIIQDHVCASFGAGLSTALVVDVGDQKMSVSCVEDGISIPQSRVCKNTKGPFKSLLKILMRFAPLFRRFY